MNTDDTQFPVANNKKKTRIANTTSTLTMSTDKSKVNVGRDTSLMHQTGSQPISYTGPWRLSGAGKAGEVGAMLHKFKHAKEEGFND